MDISEHLMTLCIIDNKSVSDANTDNKHRWKKTSQRLLVIVFMMK